MSILCVEDIAFVRFRAPDLEAMEAFLLDFGLAPAARADGALWMRAAGEAPFVHATRLGDAGFDGLGLRAASLADLDRLAASEGVPVEDLVDPGGGRVVRLRDPDGHAVEVVAGQAQVAARPPSPREPTNDAHGRPRRNLLRRVGAGPSQVQRLGHCVLNVSDFAASAAWYRERFGLIPSDEIVVGDPPFAIGAFLRCDRGEVATDHHTLFLLGTGAPAFNHAAFEVADLDDLMVGSAHLGKTGRTHEWGVGRHLLGSQIFDYWRDPWGHTLEHWTDGDLLTAGWGTRQATLEDLVGVQWGAPMPPTMG